MVGSYRLSMEAHVADGGPQFNRGDAIEEELTSAIEALNEDETLDLITLIWIRGGDFTLNDWREAREDARRISRAQAASYVLVAGPT
jgi:hypothetical protein